MRRILTILMLVLTVMSSLNSFGNSQNSNTNHIKNVTAITEVFGDGQKVTAVAVEYDSDIATSKLTQSAFTVEGRTIINVYANGALAKTSKGVDGKYVIIELSPTDKGASLLGQSGRSRIVLEAKVTVSQTGEVIAANGKKYEANPDPMPNINVVNMVVDDFKQLEYKDPKTGLTLKYNLYIPKNYNKNKTYPMVLFMHDASVVGTDFNRTLVQGLGAVIWATPSEQAKHECFVLAPQYEKIIVNDQSEMTEEGDVTVSLIDALAKRYNIDTNRLYTTGQSMGCMTSIALNIKYPELFAASFLVAGQWDASLVAPLAKDKLWIIVSEGDLKAFPEMNAITAVLEKEGTKVSRAIWSRQSSASEFASEVNKMISEGNNIKYTVFKKGTVVPEGFPDNGGMNHMCTWLTTYNIEGIRDWLFMQKK